MEHEPEWHQYQHDYYRRLADIAVKQGENPNLLDVSIEIKQDWLPALGRTDRCRTCHIGISNPDMVDAPQPITTHPEMPDHPFSRFGCTICHAGQGRATTEEEAHGPTENWPFPLLPCCVISGSCGKCHWEREIPGNKHLTQGRQLMEKSGCIGCHNIRDSQKPERIAPSLEGIGSKVNAAWLYRWLKNPNDYLSHTRMPNFHLSDDEATGMVAFLMGSIAELIPYPDESLSEERLEELYINGKIRVSESRCITCHSFEGRGGAIGPDLTRVGEKVNRTWLYSWLEEPQHYQPKTLMPHFSFPEQDILAITEFLMEEYPGEEFDAPEGLGELTPERAEHGKTLLKKYGCYGCHELPGGLKGGQIAPDLTGIGEKPHTKLEFGKTDIHRSAPNWLFVKLLNPRIFGSELRMPDYGFSPDEAELIISVLMGEARSGIPSEYIVRGNGASAYDPQGPFRKVLDEYRCLTCHSIQGSGGDLAPSLSVEGSQVKREWLVKYLQVPYAIRPFMVERMPRLKIPEDRSEEIADYIMMVLRDNSIPDDIGPFAEEEVSKGKELYETRYPCTSCHAIGVTGGYYGPALDVVGDRLKSGWVYTKLKNPKAFNPLSREPNLNLSDEDARSLTAYLMTLRKVEPPSEE